MEVGASLGLLLILVGIAVIVVSMVGLLWRRGDGEGSRGYAVFLLGPVPIIMKGGGRFILIASLLVFILIIVLLLSVV